MIIKNYISFTSLVLCTLVFSIQSFAQADSTRTSSFFLDNQKKIKPLHLSLLDTTKKTSILNFKPKQLFIIKPPANTYFDPLNATKKKAINFMSQTTNNDESDVMVKRSFLGKDASNVKLSSDFNLGTLYSTSKMVRIEVRDHSLVDGDRIKVYVNEQVINSNIMLNGLYYIIPVNLKKGYNRIDIEAINEGYSGPNTAEIKVYDEKGYLLSSQEWNILTGQRATLGVVRD